jgi:CrcB protein
VNGSGRDHLAVFVGGVIGTLARLGLTEWVEPEPGHWPWATFAANLAGCLVLGFAVTRLADRGPRAETARSFVGTGLCGALTTFSTLQLELLEMLDSDALGLAVGYAAASIALGLLLIVAGTRAVRALRASP